MSKKVKWGVLGAARIATVKVIPAMQRSSVTHVVALASRNLDKAKAAAASLGIRRFYGSYEELLTDPEVEAIYNPLPNHLHVPWSIRAAEAGKHVLCEKPISLTVAECRELMDVRERTGVKIGEAFMVRSHPQWLRTRELLRRGNIGRPRSISMVFSYHNVDPKNVRNVPEWGGGGLMDIGCYPIQLSRFVLEQEPHRVIGSFEHDPSFGTDRLTSAILEFPETQCIFTVSTQMAPYQRFQIIGTEGRIEVEIPVNAPPDRPTRIFVETSAGLRTEEFPVCDQYTLQGDEFSRAIREDSIVPTPLEDSVRNMAVIEALVESGRAGTWIDPRQYVD